MSLPVTTTPEADEQIRNIDDWWRENRSSAPNLFADELLAAFDVIGHTPQIGRVYRQSPVLGTRRILLKGSRYHVYYVPRAADVRVLAAEHKKEWMHGGSRVRSNPAGSHFVVIEQSAFAGGEAALLDPAPEPFVMVDAAHQQVQSDFFDSAPGPCSEAR